MSFYRKRTHFIHLYSLNGSTLKRVSIIKDLGFYITPTLSSEHHINITEARSLKVLGFLQHNTKTFHVCYLSSLSLFLPCPLYFRIWLSCMATLLNQVLIMTRASSKPFLVLRHSFNQDWPLILWLSIC
jgi:hypothetical protein